MNVLAVIEDEDIRATITASFKTLDEGQTLEKIEDLDALYRASEIFSGIDIPVRFLTNSEDENALKNTMDLANEVRALGSQGGLLKDGELDVGAYGAIVGEDVANRAAAVADALGEQFDTLSEAEKLEFFTQFAINVQFTGDGEAIAFLKSQGMEMGLEVDTPEQRDVVLGQQIKNILPQMTPLAAPGESEKPLDSGSGGGAEPQIDSLIKKLRDLRIATVDMKKGWKGMQQVLESVFAGGTKGIDVFEGLSNQIRRMGVGENLIEMIVGMDPDEYNKRKNELFVFDKGGNIVGTTAKLKNMNAAFNAIAIGEYINSQQSFIENARNQSAAISILTANGMSLSEAYQLVQDEALAAAIAMGATKAEIQEILRITGLAKQQRQNMEKEQEKSRISDSVRKTNEEFRNQVAVLNQLSRAQGQYTDAQIQAIMGDSDLQKLFLNPSIDPKALQEALKNAEQQANLQVQIAIAQGNEIEPFENFMSEVSDYFSKAEAVINIDFEVATADDNKLVEDAQNQIADIQYRLDDYNAELERISWIEEEINDKYDKRSEALDEIASANQKIVNQQKSQLDIAEALSRGDISAAARAVQELRAQQAADTASGQKEMLEKQRDAELAAVTAPGGQTRKQLEDAIKDLERQVFELEEGQLEPAQERIRLAEIARNLAIEQLELNGMNRQEFEALAAATRLADLDMENMVLSARKLAALAEFIRTGNKGADWEELFPTQTASPPPRAPSPPRAPAPAPATPPASPPSPPRPPVVPPPPTPPPTNVGNGFGAGWGTRPPSQTFIPGTPAVNRGTGFGAGWGTPPTAPNRHVINPAPPARPINPGTGFGPGRSSGGMIIPKRMAMGGNVKGYPMGGLIPYKMNGGLFNSPFPSLGSDTIPAMLTPGEFVIRRPAVNKIGVDKLEQINRGTYSGGSVYNYNLSVNVKSESDPNRIARTVIAQIKQVDNQRIRGNKL
jgi:hypothetical protein